MCTFPIILWLRKIAIEMIEEIVNRRTFVVPYRVTDFSVAEIPCGSKVGRLRDEDPEETSLDTGADQMTKTHVTRTHVTKTHVTINPCDEWPCDDAEGGGRVLVMSRRKRHVGHER